jgi:hypothetical protein
MEKRTGTAQTKTLKRVLTDIMTPVLESSYDDNLSTGGIFATGIHYFRKSQ